MRRRCAAANSKTSREGIATIIGSQQDMHLVAQAGNAAEALRAENDEL